MVKGDDDDDHVSDSVAVPVLCFGQAGNSSCCGLLSRRRNRSIAGRTTTSSPSNTVQDAIDLIYISSV